MVEPETDVNMAYAPACCITKAADTHPDYIILIAFTRQHWLSERASMLRFYVHCLCSVPQITFVKIIEENVFLFIEP
jgi:hypothetical protein